MADPRKTCESSGADIGNTYGAEWMQFTHVGVDAYPDGTAVRWTNEAHVTCSKACMAHVLGFGPEPGVGESPCRPDPNDEPF